MTTVLWWLLQNTLAIALLVAIVAALRPMLRTRPALEHALWLIVLIKFVTPPIVTWPWTARDFAAAISTIENALGRPPASSTDLTNARPAHEPGGWGRVFEPPAGTHSIPNGGRLEDSIRAGRDSEAPATRPLDEADENSTTDPGGDEIAARLADLVDAMERGAALSLDGNAVQPAATPRDASADLVATPQRETRVQALVAAGRSIVGRFPMSRLAPLVLGVWLAGGLATAVAQSRRLARHWRLVRHSTEPPRHLVNEIGRLAAAMHVRPISARVVSGLSSPLVWCVGWLRLLWPESLASESHVRRCRGMIAHELAHVRRRDHWVAWLELVAGVVWWWNPLFWLVRRRLRETAEIACDAVAMSVLPDDRLQYAEAFLELSSIGKTWAPAPVLGMSTGARQTFERRFAMILSESVVCKMSLRGLLAVGLLATVTLPSWSLGQVTSPDGQGSASVSSDGTAGPANQPAASPAQSEARPILDPDLAEIVTKSDEPDLAQVAKRSVPPEQRPQLRGGVVSDIDTQSGLVTVSIGRKHGVLQKGDSLELHRVQPNPGSLGKITVFDVSDDHSIFRPDAAMLAEFRQGDAVYVNILVDGPRGPTVSSPTGLGIASPANALTKRTFAEAVAANQGYKSLLGDLVGEARSDDSLESRVQALEQKLDTILDELRKLRGASSPRPPLRQGGAGSSLGGTTGAGVGRSNQESPARSAEAQAGRVYDARTLQQDRIVERLQNIRAYFKEVRAGATANPEKVAEAQQVLAEFRNYQKHMLKVSTDAMVAEVYLHVLERGPTDAELTAARRELELSRGSEKFYDILVWRLINSLEISSRGAAVKLDKNQSGSSGGRSEIIPPPKLNPNSRRGTSVPALPEAQPQPSQRPAGSIEPRVWNLEERSADAGQIDLVNLATQTVEARGAVRLAESRHDRLARAGAAISQEEVETAAINLETARQKLDVLTRIAQARLNTAKAELDAALERAEYSRKMFEKGYVTQSQATEAVAKATIADANLKLIESIVSPSSPAGSTEAGAKPDNLKPDNLKLDFKPDLKLDNLKLDLKPDLKLDNLKLDLIPDLKLDNLKLDLKPDLKLDNLKPDNLKPDSSSLRVSPLKYANATDVVAAIEKLVGPSGGDSGAKFTANVRTNAIFVVGDEDSIAAITELVRRLDVPAEKVPPPPPSKK